MAYIYHFYATYMEEDDSIVEFDGIIEAPGMIATAKDYDSLKSQIARGEGLEYPDELILHNLSLLYSSSSFMDMPRSGQLMN